MPEILTHAPELLARYRAAPTGLVCDSLGRLGLAGFMDDVLPLDSSWHISGRIRTVSYAPRGGIRRTSQSIYSIARRFEVGDVLVIGTGGTRSWILGENVAHMAMYQGLVGIVTDGRVRDGGELRELAFPVFSRGLAVRPPSADIELVDWDVPIACGGAQVRPGDILVGDGVVVVPGEAAEPITIELDDLAALELEQERAIEARASMPVIQEILARKKQRRGPPFAPKQAG
ncbi:MAG TPA: RraA family protein [Geminicoccaceae bacterium]|nr:RraA family protein [Geminicoccaceae bacterium]